MPISNDTNIAVLVVSCDSYSDLWNPFFECFKRFWPDCPYKVYLMSNKKTFDRQGVTNVLTEDDPSWSDSLINGVSQIKEDYIFMFLDDLFLVKPVDTKKVLEVFDWAVSNDVNYLRTYLMTNNKPDKQYNRLVGSLSKKMIYRASTVMVVWKKQVLLDLLKSGESAWDFEVQGTVRADKYDDFYATWQNLFTIVNTVIKGKWRRDAAGEIQSLGIEIDLKARDLMTPKEAFSFKGKLLRSRLLSFFPVRFRRKIRSLFINKRSPDFPGEVVRKK